MHCKTCGNLLVDEGKVCKVCGTVADSNNGENEISRDSSSEAWPWDETNDSSINNQRNDSYQSGGNYNSPPTSNNSSEQMSYSQDSFGSKKKLFDFTWDSEIFPSEEPVETEEIDFQWGAFGNEPPASTKIAKIGRESRERDAREAAERRRAESEAIFQDDTNEDTKPLFENPGFLNNQKNEEFQNMLDEEFDIYQGTPSDANIGESRINGDVLNAQVKTPETILQTPEENMSIEDRIAQFLEKADKEMLEEMNRRINEQIEEKSNGELPSSTSAEALDFKPIDNKPQTTDEFSAPEQQKPQEQASEKRALPAGTIVGSPFAMTTIGSEKTISDFDEEPKPQNEELNIDFPDDLNDEITDDEDDVFLISDIIDGEDETFPPLEGTQEFAKKEDFLGTSDPNDIPASEDTFDSFNPIDESNDENVLENKDTIDPKTSVEEAFAGIILPEMPSEFDKTDDSTPDETTESAPIDEIIDNSIEGDDEPLTLDSIFPDEEALARKVSESHRANQEMDPALSSDSDEEEIDILEELMAENESLDNDLSDDQFFDGELEADDDQALEIDDELEKDDWFDIDDSDDVLPEIVNEPVVFPFDDEDDDPKGKRARAEKREKAKLEKRNKKFEDDVEDDGDEKEKSSKVLLIIVDILVILAILCICAFAITKFAPESGIAGFINDSVKKVASIFDRGSSDSEESTDTQGQQEAGTFVPPSTDKETLIASQLYNDFSNNIAQVSVAPEATFQENVTYPIPGANTSKPIENNYWTEGEDTPLLYDESAVATIIRYNSNLVSFINNPADQSVFDDLEGGDAGAAGQTLAQYASTVDSIVFTRLGIGDIRTDGTSFYVWTIETVTETFNSIAADKTYMRLYMLTPDIDTMKVNEIAEIV